ncbi:MAG: hypothetical protein U0271_09390 [Polyangiaceae bacterium]
MRSLSVRLYDAPKREDVDAVAGRLAAVLEVLGRGDASWAPACRDPRATVERSRRPCEVGGARTAFGVELAGRVTTLSMIAGVDWPLPSAWIPHQIVVRFRGGLELGKAALLLEGLAKVVSPTYGHVAVDEWPRPPLPPFANDKPVFGYATYLRAAPALPPLPPPFITRPLVTGLLIQPREADLEHVDRTFVGELARVLAKVV